MYKYFESYLEDLKEKQSYRSIKKPYFHNGCFLFDGDRKILNLSSNDYLGIGFDSSFFHEFISKIGNDIENYFLASSGSRLLSGNSFSYEILEETLKGFYKKDVLVLNSGYHANVGVISSLFDNSDVIFFDKFCHASIIDGIKLSGSRFYRFDHLDYNHLERLLSKYRGNYKKSVIITESIFSMDGDVCDIEALVYLKEKYNSFLYIDEAHSVGVMGEKGLGLSFKEKIFDRVDIFIGTFGKAYASIGSFVVCDSIIKEFLINRARSFIYTTALPPMILSWNNFVLNKSFYDLEYRREALKKKASFLRDTLSSFGIKLIGSTQIIPLIVGENKDALKLSEYLYNNGFYALAIRYPTVPQGSARIRISLNSLIEYQHIENFCEVIKDFYEKYMA